ncbi:hypothetical protein BDD12DRAFT_983625 [Trichophaea hybrida]|nr:hypothetical protein BDD12DRAFT_983625 [Trichophaea hybrida]
MSQITDTPRPNTPPQVPDRSTSLGVATGYVAYNSEADAPSRAAKKKLKRSASTLNKYVDVDRWWFANDELMTAQGWDTCQIKHLKGIAALRESLGNQQEERIALHKGLNQNFDLTPQPSRNFVTLLLEFLEVQETRSSNLQSQFRKELIDVYGGYDEGRINIFCPVVGGFLDPERVKAAHIYPYVLGTTVMRMIFGDEGAGEIFHVRNGLLLADFVEKRFDKHHVGIVPAKDARLQRDGTIDRWVLNEVDDSIKDIRVGDINGTFADLHGKELTFRTLARPAARYLHIQYLIAMLRGRKHRKKLFKPKLPQDDNNDGRSGSTDARPVPWGTPGPYIRERMVRALVAEAGMRCLWNVTCKKWPFLKRPLQGTKRWLWRRILWGMAGRVGPPKWTRSDQAHDHRRPVCRFVFCRGG